MNTVDFTNYSKVEANSYHTSFNEAIVERSYYSHFIKAIIHMN